MNRYSSRTCPVCENKDPDLIGWVEQIKMVHRLRCHMCGLIYFDRNHYPKPKYDLKYNKFFFRPGDIRKAGAMAATIGEILDLKKGHSTILEVGPGNGLTSFLLTQQGFKVEAIEMDSETCWEICNKYKIDTWPGRFEERPLPGEYDLIYAGHVIEHCERSLEFFFKARKLLKREGLFFFDTPDTHYQKKHGISWKHFRTRNPYEHCCLFSFRTVEFCAKFCGFKIESVISLPEFESMQCLLRKQ